MTDRYEELLDQLTLDEQAALTAGADDWHVQGLPDHGIPRLKTTDGPVGARGESYTTTTSALFPCGSALGATFDPDLIRRVGAAIADEVRTKAAHVLLGPTLNLIRHPLGGRNFEAYSEDPTHTARLAAAFVEGVQSRGVAACAKHFVANDAEIERLTISSDVDERTLREVYLRPFEAAVRDGGVWTVMGSYNRINGIFGCEHDWLLTTVLREEWGFDGVVMSDWFATHDTTASALAGLDLEMPGRPRHFGPALAAAVERGEVPAEEVTDKARRVLRLLDRVGASGEEHPERSEDDAGRWALARDVSAASMVLLRNAPVDGRPVLPLEPAALGRVAVIGPNAATAVVQGGGSARVTPHRTVTPLDGLRERLGTGVDVVHEPGSRRPRMPALDGRYARAGSQPGIRVTYTAEPGGEPQFTNVIPTLDAVWSGRFARDVDPRHFHARAEAELVAQRTGDHELGLTSIGPCQLLLDGEVVLDTTSTPIGLAFFGYGSEEVRATVPMVEGQRYDLAVTYDMPRGRPLGALRVGLQPPLGADPAGAAVDAAAGADVAIVVVGTDEVEETEGNDRLSMSLGVEQDELVRRVVAANPRTVVVVNAGSAVDLPWADEIPAIVQMWFPGMAGGEALARVLVGDDEPAGRLPFTVPVQMTDAPCDISRADPPGHLRYTEGLAVGHRWYLTRDIEPRWWFGAGQGYTSFEWHTPSAPSSWAPGTPLLVSLPVTNVGDRDGVEVAQVYLGRAASIVDRPRWAFGGSAKARIAAGATAVLSIEIDPATIRHWDGDRGWTIEPGPLEVRVARSAGDPGQVLTVNIA